MCEPFHTFNKKVSIRQNSLNVDFPFAFFPWSPRPRRRSSLPVSDEICVCTWSIDGPSSMKGYHLLERKCTLLYMDCTCTKLAVCSHIFVFLLLRVDLNICGSKQKEDRPVLPFYGVSSVGRHVVTLFCSQGLRTSQVTENYEQESTETKNIHLSWPIWSTFMKLCTHMALLTVNKFASRTHNLRLERFSGILPFVKNTKIPKDARFSYLSDNTLEHTIYRQIYFIWL